MAINEVLERYGFTSRYTPPVPAEPESLNDMLDHLEEKFKVEPAAETEPEADNPEADNE